MQQQLNNKSLFSISYVGNKGTHLTSSYDINQIPQSNWLNASFVNGSQQTALRPFSNYSTLTWWAHDGNSNFHGLETLIKTRIQNLQLLAAYTWSHSIADIIVDDSSGGLGAQTRTYYPDPRLDRGNGDVNRPNNFVANAVYNLPSLAGKEALIHQGLGGWELSGIVTAANGNNFTVYQGVSENTTLLTPTAQISGTTGAVVLGPPPGAGALNALAQTGYPAPIRPLKVANQSPIAGRKGDLIINPNAFTLVGYQIGTIPSNMEPRGYIGGPNFNNTDLSLDKNFPVKERVTVQFRLDFFNLWNHANFNPSSLSQGAPIQNVNCGPVTGSNGTSPSYAPCSATNSLITRETQTPGFGTSNGLIGGNSSRQIQYTLHINF